MLIRKVQMNVFFVARSPSGTRSQISRQRPLDYATAEYRKFISWPMMTVHFWDEPVSFGPYKSNWTFEWEINLEQTISEDNTINFLNWILIFHGTDENYK